MNAPDEHGLLAITRYALRLRLERSEMLAQLRWMAPGLRSLAKGRRAIANWDEDVVTMAVRTLLRTRAVPVAELTLASTTLPFAQRLNAGIVASAIGLREVGSCARAALAELAAALRRTAEGPTVVVAAERRVAKPASAQEMIQGHGAAAAPVGCGDAVATEVHDCFSVTETVLMEDLGFSAPGRALHDVLDGVFERPCALPVQPGGGLKCFGHPIGASPLKGTTPAARQSRFCGARLKRTTFN